MNSNKIKKSDGDLTTALRKSICNMIAMTAREIIAGANDGKEMCFCAKCLRLIPVSHLAVFCKSRPVTALKGRIKNVDGSSAKIEIMPKCPWCNSTSILFFYTSDVELYKTVMQYINLASPYADDDDDDEEEDENQNRYNHRVKDLRK